MGGDGHDFYGIMMKLPKGSEFWKYVQKKTRAIRLLLIRKFTPIL